MIRFIGNILIHLSTLEALAFVTLYHLNARWWKTEAGKYMMIWGVVVTMVLMLSSISLITGAGRAGATWFLILRTLTFAAVPIMLGWQLRLLYTLQKAGKENDDGDTSERYGRDPSRDPSGT
jgi:hypothetical protein